MNNFGMSLDELLQEATRLLDADRTEEARQVLREALNLDRNHLKTWELLWRAAQNLDEEISSLKHILKINPGHKSARKRMKELQLTGPKKSNSQPLARKSTPRPAVRRKRRESGTVLLLFLGGLISVLCISIGGLALYQGGYVPFLFPSRLTATALAERNASCQALIDRTIQASQNFCDNTGSNTACYGNTKLQAELIPNAGLRFSQRGDSIPVHELQRLSASPLNIENNEWGIAVFKVLANLPRSLPGETVTMVVFGNATLDNQSVGSDSLESFYFTSELGQIVCEQVPFDGLMINSPAGDGIRFKINGAELTLMGSASIKAIKNQQMEVGVYQGSARLTANGQEQYLGAGQSSTVQLGGDNGAQAVSGPSAPQTIPGDELTMACTLTGDYCSPSELTPVSAAQAQAEIDGAITSTPTLTITPTGTRTASPTEPPTYTAVVLPKPTFTSTLTPTLGPTRTPKPTRTNTPSPSKIPTLTWTPSLTPTRTFTPTITLSPTATPLAPTEPLCDPVSQVALSAFTVQGTNANELAADITNNSGSPITITRFFAYWVKSTSSQKIDKLFLNSVIWNQSDPNPPSDIPTEGNWTSTANLTIGTAPNVASFVIQFSAPVQPTSEIHIVFDLGCQVVGTH